MPACTLTRTEVETRITKTHFIQRQDPVSVGALKFVWVSNVVDNKVKTKRDGVSV
jgi:hypothetical protein